MLILRLISETGKSVEYNYYPEGKKIYGKVVIDKITGDISTVCSADDEFGRYLMHAVKRIKDYFEEGEYRAEDMVAWY